MLRNCRVTGACDAKIEQREGVVSLFFNSEDAELESFAEVTTVDWQINHTGLLIVRKHSQEQEPFETRFANLKHLDFAVFTSSGIRKDTDAFKEIEKKAEQAGVSKEELRSKDFDQMPVFLKSVSFEMTSGKAVKAEFDSLDVTLKWDDRRSMVEIWGSGFVILANQSKIRSLRFEHVNLEKLAEKPGCETSPDRCDMPEVTENRAEVFRGRFRSN